MRRSVWNQRCASRTSTPQTSPTCVRHRDITHRERHEQPYSKPPYSRHIPSIANPQRLLFSIRLIPAPAFAICFLSRPLPPTRTSTNSATACDYRTPRPSPLVASPRTHLRCLRSHLQSPQCCPARLPLRVSSGLCFTSRRPLLLALLHLPPHPPYPPHISGPLGGY